MADQKYPSQGPYVTPEGPPPEYSVPAPEPVPAPAPAQPPAQGASNVTTEKKTEKKEKKGFFSSFMKEAEKVGKEIGKGIDKAGEKLNETVDKNYSSALLDLFKTGNVVQLISRVTGKTLQIVMSPTGQLVLDANGPLDPSAFNTLWTVTNEGSNQIRLHNYNNYISIVDGQTVVTNYPPGTTHGLETKFQLSQVQQQFVTLESLKEKDKHHHVGFMPSGELKPASKTITKDPTAQMAVKLVSTAYPVVVPVTTVHK